MSKEHYHAEKVTVDNYKEHTRRVLEITFPGIRYGKFDRYQMRRCLSDDSGLLVKLGEEGSSDEIIDRYPRDIEWETIKFLSKKMFLDLGVRPPEFMWPSDIDKYFHKRVCETEMFVLEKWKKDHDENNEDEFSSGLGSLFG